MMKNNYEMVVSLELSEDHVDILKHATSYLPDYHIGRIIAINCFREWKKNNGGIINLVIPLKLKEYILEPGNAFDTVPGLLAMLIQQMDAFDGTAIKWKDDYGCTMYGRTCSSEYKELKRHIEELPEYHVVRGFLEQCLKSIKASEYSILSGKSQGSEYMGTEHLPNVMPSFWYYCNSELFEYSNKIEKDISDLSEKDEIYMNLVI